MQQLPHLYSAKVKGEPESDLTTHADNLPVLHIAPPTQFGGPGDQWSPEELLMASIANCLVLSFRAISKASKLDWLSIECESTGELDKAEGKIKFTLIRTNARLLIAAGERLENAEKLLHKAEKACFISNSLNCESDFQCEIAVADK